MTRRTQLLRLVDAINQRPGIKVELRRVRGRAGRSIVIKRHRRKPVKFYPHTSRLNLELLAQYAVANIKCGGAGMGWDEVALAVPSLDYENTYQRRRAR